MPSRSVLNFFQVGAWEGKGTEIADKTATHDLFDLLACGNVQGRQIVGNTIGLSTARRKIGEDHR